jgi:hypothetical protein
MSRTRTTFAITLLLLAPALLANDAGQVRTTARQELEQLQRTNGAKYAQDLYNNSDKWSYVSMRIATGRHEWLQVAKALSPYVDGAFSEELSTDLASALLERPASVLTLLKETNGSAGLTAFNVCDAPFPTPGKKWLSRYKARAIKTVGSVRETGLRKLRDDCLKALHSIDLSQPANAYE